MVVCEKQMSGKSLEYTAQPSDTRSRKGWGCRHVKQTRLKGTIILLVSSGTSQRNSSTASSRVHILAPPFTQQNFTTSSQQAHISSMEEQVFETQEEFYHQLRKLIKTHSIFEPGKWDIENRIGVLTYQRCVSELLRVLRLGRDFPIIDNVTGKDNATCVMVKILS